MRCGGWRRGRSGSADRAFAPQGLLPVQLPKDMETVERQKEDVPFDMEGYQDEEGHVYDFGFGMDYNGPIEDERVRRYGADRNGHTHQQ